MAEEMLPPRRSDALWRARSYIARALGAPDEAEDQRRQRAAAREPLATLPAAIQSTTTLANIRDATTMHRLAQASGADRFFARYRNASNAPGIAEFALTTHTHPVPPLIAHSHTVTPVVTTRAAAVTVPAGTTGGRTTACLGGELCVGGGHDTGLHSTGISVSLSAPSGSPPTGWAVILANGLGSDITLTVYALCLTSPIVTSTAP